MPDVDICLQFQLQPLLFVYLVIVLGFWAVARWGMITYGTTAQLYSFYLFSFISLPSPPRPTQLSLRPSQLPLRPPELPLRPSQLRLRPTQFTLNSSQLCQGPSQVPQKPSQQKGGLRCRMEIHL